MKKFHFNFYPTVLEFVLSRREEILSEKTGFDGCLWNGFLRISTAESIFIFCKTMRIVYNVWAWLRGWLRGVRIPKPGGACYESRLRFFEEEGSRK